MELTKQHAETLKKYLTKSAKKKLLKKISDSGITITTRQINNILNGKCDDNHGILNMAIKEASFVKQSETHTKKRMEKLNS